MLIGAEGARLLRDKGAGETPQARSAEEAPRTARGKRAPAVEINSQVKQELQNIKGLSIKSINMTLWTALILVIFRPLPAVCEYPLKFPLQRN